MKTFCTKEKYDQITKNLAKKIGLMILGGVVGAIIAALVMNGDVGGGVAGIIAGACFPYAWSKIPFKVSGFGLGFLIMLLVKFAIALLLGAFITPATFLYDLIRVIVYNVQKNKIAKADNQTSM